ncbi:MAG: hypothetical protein H0W06_11935 [Chloroflexia bacterium]|nr:hypothetical protein [Chloroflexia bacterium]
MYLAWYDPDRRRPAHRKLADAIAAYAEKYGRLPVQCLTHRLEAEQILAIADRPSLRIKAVPFVPRNTFYVGESDADEPAAIAA